MTSNLPSTTPPITAPEEEAIASEISASSAPNQPSGGAMQAPAEGERRAMRGYVGQYRAAAAVIYSRLQDGSLNWVGLAARWAGVADDVVIGFQGRVVGHQFKLSQHPAGFTISARLTGADGMIEPLASAWQRLVEAHPHDTVEVAFVTNDYPSVNDTVPHFDRTLLAGGDAHSAAFVRQFCDNPDRKLEQWRLTPWAGFVNQLQLSSGLDEKQFDRFFRSLRLLVGPESNFADLHRLSEDGTRQAIVLADKLPRLVATDARDRWSRSEFLDAVGWRDTAVTLRSHQFPVGPYVQRNVRTEAELDDAMASALSGYVALLGPPGTGKSTLLQTSLRNQADSIVVRYLAYVPGIAQNVGRGEAETFLEDLATQLRSTGLTGLRFLSESLLEKREQFGTLMRHAGERFARDRIRTVIVLDGLDHVPREERPTQSFLGELPLPTAIPDGVVFVLGSQTLDLAALPPAVRDQASTAGRCVEVKALPRPALDALADSHGLAPEVPRDRLYERCLGHPLVSRYLIEALLIADEAERIRLLDGGFVFAGDVEQVYASAWRGVENSPDAVDMLFHLARAEGPMPLDLLAQQIPDAGIERALLATRHLLVDSQHGWSMFHNSFRLFVMGKPKIRLGRPVANFDAEIYRGLARLARLAAVTSPQRWLELRYLARIGDDQAVLALAQPARFRQQMFEGRSVSEQIADLQLCFQAARRLLEPTTVVRLLLIRDELGRRTDALDSSTKFAAALVATGQIDAAEAYAGDFQSSGFKVVDALLARGEHQRAEQLFDRLDPIAQVLSGRLRHSGSSEREKEFTRWATRAFHFRDVEQIERAIEALSAQLANTPGANAIDTAQAATELRRELLHALVTEHPNADAADQLTRMRGDPTWLAELLTKAGLSAWARNDRPLALQRFTGARAEANFADVPNSWRRAMATAYAQSGALQEAEALFDNLAPPDFADIEETFDEGAATYIVRAMIEHHALASFLGKPAVLPTSRPNALAGPLQTHAVAAGTLLGRRQAARNSGHANAIIDGEALRAARSALQFLARARAHDPGDFSLMNRVRKACSELGRALIAAAGLSAHEEFAAVTAEIDCILNDAPPTSAISNALRRAVAESIFRIDSDTQMASRRLERMVNAQVLATPHEHIDALAELAVSFANVGNPGRGRELLSLAMQQTLGIAAPAKKDPIYSMWIEVMALANTADPSNRGSRVEFLLHQIIGMSQTEGDSAAERMASVLVKEAAWHAPAHGMWAARKLLEAGITKWPSLVDALLIGTVNRRPQMAAACATAWSGLSLPHLYTPYYRKRDSAGDFVANVIEAAATEQLPQLVRDLLRAVEAMAQHQTRSAILRRLQRACAARGHPDSDLDVAVARWADETPTVEDHGTPLQFDEITNLTNLPAAVAAASTGDSAPLWSSRAFTRLASEAGYAVARRVFEELPDIGTDSRARFALFDLAMDAGDLAYANELLQGYLSQPQESATWTSMFEGSLQRYFGARVRLEGPTAHGAALADLLRSVIAGRENFSLLVAELEDLLPIVAGRPDWPAIWDMLAEQMSNGREFTLGTPSCPDAALTAALPDGESLIASLLTWHFKIPLEEAVRAARLTTLQMNEVAGGGAIFEKVVRQLLSDGQDSQLRALELLLLDRNESLRGLLEGEIRNLVDSEDFAVGEMAATLCHRWRLDITRKQTHLPIFYSLELPGTEISTDAQLFTDEDTGAMTVENARGWTTQLGHIEELLIRDGVDKSHISERVGMFIEEWSRPLSPLEAFGRPATLRRRGELSRLGLQLPFFRPHLEVALRGLRRVAGELRFAGKIEVGEVADLLYQFLTHPFERDMVVPAPRPVWLQFPQFQSTGWRDDENHQAWLEGVEKDLAPFTQIAGGEVVLGEMTKITMHWPNRYDLKMERIRAPFLSRRDNATPTAYAYGLPRATMRNGLRAIGDDASPFLVRRMDRLTEAPTHDLIVCPIWAQRLRWRLDPNNRSIMLDASSTVVARMFWWRDGGPSDYYRENQWAEGSLVLLTVEGLEQLERLLGAPVTLRTFAQRTVTPLPERSGRKSRGAFS
jgi:hypothetical protein